MFLEAREDVVLTLVSQEGPEGHLLLLFLLGRYTDHHQLYVPAKLDLSVRVLAQSHRARSLAGQAYPCLRFFKDLCAGLVVLRGVPGSRLKEFGSFSTVGSFFSKGGYQVRGT